MAHNTFCFQNLVSKQLDEIKILLSDKWYSRIQTLLQKGVKKKHVPDMTKAKTLKRFYDSISALMSQNLSDITIRTLHKFTEFMCDIGVRINIQIVSD